jgi:hypothetical protein
MKHFLVLVFLTLWLLWAAGPAVTGSLALRNTNPSPLYYIVTGIVKLFVIYIMYIENLLRSILIGLIAVRGP